MKDSIYIRYFVLRTDEIPADSARIVTADNPLASRYINDYLVGNNVTDWLEKYPNGRVDFVRL